MSLFLLFCLFIPNLTQSASIRDCSSLKNKAEYDFCKNEQMRKAQLTELKEKYPCSINEFSSACLREKNKRLKEKPIILNKIDHSQAPLNLICKKWGGFNKIKTASEKKEARLKINQLTKTESNLTQSNDEISASSFSSLIDSLLLQKKYPESEELLCQFNFGFSEKERTCMIRNIQKRIDKTNEFHFNICDCEVDSKSGKDHCNL